MPHKNAPDTRRDCPSSLIIKAENTRCALSMLSELRNTLVESGLTEQELSKVNQQLGSFSGTVDHSLNTGAVYAYLVEALSLNEERVEKIVEEVRVRCSRAARAVPPPPPNTASGEYRLEIATPHIAPLTKPFTHPRNRVKKD